MTLGPNEVLGDRYIVRKIEWSTPLGPMWSGRDKVLDRQVFVQVLAGSVADDRDARHAFKKAAARIAQITHPGVLQVFDIGDTPPFVVFEHAAGGKLSQRLQSGAMRTQDVARIALAVASALEAIHERAAWHGSLSPETVIFDSEGRPKLLATGLADTARASSTIDTAAEQPVSYRPPEPSPIPADADRYALAALTYHMLTGRAPAAGVTARQQRRSVPDPIDRLLARALSPQQADRPTLDEFVGALAPFARVEPKAAREKRVSTGEFRWLLPVGIIVALAVAAATFGVEFVRDLSKPDATPAPTKRARAVGTPFPAKTVTDFDPFGRNRVEDPEDADLATDGDPDTSWETECYADRDLGAKPGVGLLFDLGTVRRVGQVRLQSAIPGWKGELRVGTEEGDDHEAFTVAKSFEVQLDQRIALPAETRARYVLLWITGLAVTEEPCKFPHRAAISEVEFFV